MQEKISVMLLNTRYFPAWLRLVIPVSAMSHRFNPLLSSKIMGQNRTTVYPPIPQPFVFNTATRHPLIPFAAVTTRLGRTARDINALVEEGKLCWAFDIRSARARRREVRVLSQSLVDYIGDRSRRDSKGTGDWDVARVVNLVLPEGIILSPETFSAKPAEGNSRLMIELYRRLHLPAALARDMLFPREPVLYGTDVAESFCCLGQHISNLIRERTLKAVNFRRGPKSTPLVTRESVVEFLKNRRIL